MDKKDLIAIVRNKLDLEQFSAFSKGAGALIFTKKNDKTQEQLVISYKKYPGIYNFRASVSGWKEFAEVEDVLSKYFKPYDMGENRVTIHNSSRRFEEIEKIDISEPTDINKVLPKLHAMVYEDILPFFERYQTLEDVHRELTTYGNDFDKINKFLFTPQPIRRMIIKRLFNDPDWEEFAFNLTNSVVARAKSDVKSQVAVYAQFLPELFEELKSMKF